ncbi:gluconolactonase [Lampropedia cohaerens]|uniref:Gluconolactonase n=1 Tax=Lampropedia cohaerens TaxID=1610491 RepID=A0A0U1PWV0_9BURK|nr:gluconolactonase [Lampropedia cohaerens]
MHAELLVHTHDTVGESPVWDPVGNCLYWTDIDASRVHRLDWNSQTVRTWTTPEKVGCIGLHAHGGLVAGMVTQIAHLALPETDNAPATLQAVIHTCTHAQAQMRCNDGRVDRQGRFWSTTMVMNMGLAAPAGQLLVTTAGQTRQVWQGLVTPNGTAFSPDGQTLYLSDSHPSVQKVWAFDVAADGSLHNQRLFIDMQPMPGRPDGAAVDADGCYWICGNDAGVVYRFTPDGRLDRSVSVPVDKPAMCAFAGPRLDTLVITSIRPAQPPGGQEALAGAVFAVVPGVTGLPEACYRAE